MDASIVVRSAAEQGEHLGRNQGVEFKVRLPADAMPTQADPDTLRRALLVSALLVMGSLGGGNAAAQSTQPFTVSLRDPSPPAQGADRRPAGVEDGFVSRDRRYLHFAYDDNRSKAVHYSARLAET